MNPITLLESIFALFAVYIFIRMEKIMAAIDDLNAVVTSVSTDVQSVIALLKSNDDGAIEAAVAKLQAVDDALKAAIPPAPPTP